MKTHSIYLLLSTFLFTGAFAVDFSWHDTEGKHLDLHYKDKPIIRYQYETIDESSPGAREKTYKPFHHVFDPEGKDFITKGPGGKYTHHRGIYYGFSKCSYTDAEGKKHGGIDTWHCRKAHQVHRKIVEKTTGESNATMTSEISWISNEGFEFATEYRTLAFSYNPDGDLVVSFQSELRANVPKVKVDGDPQHAGFHFRASNEVAEKTQGQTYYIRPKTGKGDMGKTINWSGKNDDETTRDLPWKAMSFVTGGERYSVLYVDSPENPKPARFSERPYGRFGSYFVKEFTPDEPLKVAYKLVIRKGEMDFEKIKTLNP